MIVQAKRLSKNWHLLQIRACTTTRYSVAELWMNEEGKDLYPSTLTDAEWNWMESLLPEPAKLGRPPRYSKREVLNGIFYITRSGCGWRMMPKDLPPWRICYHYFAEWQKESVWERMHDALRDELRQASGKKKLQALRLSTRRVLKRLITPDCVALMLERSLWDERGMWSWIPRDSSSGF